MKIKLILIFIFVIGIFSFSNLIFDYSFKDLGNSLASVFFTDSITKAELINKYKSSQYGGQKVKILIVPGHDDESVGTSFRGLKEADLNLRLGEELSAFFNEDGNFQVVLVREKHGLNNNFSEFLKNNEKIISDFIKDKKTIMKNFIDAGEVKSISGVVHNNAPNRIVLKLYGINRWANEIGADIVLHIHFNDYPRRSFFGAGKYSGFAIYIPEKQFSNAKASQAVAENIFNQLKQFAFPSNLKKENGGLVEDQDLIAIGAYNTLDAVGILMEYGYIYEPQFLNKKIREQVIKELAYQTYLGVSNFFKGLEKVKLKQNSTILPHTWTNNLMSGLKKNSEVLALQTALKTLNIYPPIGSSGHNCPVSGNFGSCTRRAIVNFQKAYGIMPSSGFVGPLTISKLNRLFSGSIFD